MNRFVRHICILVLTTVLFGSGPAWSAVDRDQEVRDAVTAFVTARTSGMGWEVRIRRMTVADALKFPDGPTDYEVVAPQQWGGWGSISIAVLARQKDKVVRNIPVRLDVEAMANSVVTLHQIEHGAVIASADLAVQKREITQNSQRAARNLEEVVGRKARTTLRANQPVSHDQIEKIPMIKSGQMVTIIAENGALKVSVTGKASSSGGEGDIIRVQNLMSQKEIPAKVVDVSTVQVAF